MGLYGLKQRPVTLCTGQWADLPLATLAEKASTNGCSGFGYDGLELACWGEHFDVYEAVKGGHRLLPRIATPDFGRSQLEVLVGLESPDRSDRHRPRR